LAGKSPRLLGNFLSFMESTRAVDYGGKSLSPGRRWVKAPLNRLERLDDEGNIDEMPDDCRIGYPVVRFYNVWQTVVRTSRNGSVRYVYSGPAFKHLLRMGGHQMSFMFVHEWLRDYTHDPEAIRHLNWFLHSKAAHTLSPREFRGRLRRLGMPVF
jgi:hypothetical protein